MILGRHSRVPSNHGIERSLKLTEPGKAASAVASPVDETAEREYSAPFLLFVAVFLYGVASYLTLLAPEGLFNSLIEEERWIEGPGALALFAGSVLWFLCFLKARRLGEHWLKQLVLVGLAFLFFFGGGEEVSWGQRIIGYGTPEAIEHANAQNELNIHNLKTFEGIAEPDTIFQLFWFGFGVGVPLLAAVSRAARDLIGRFIPIVPLGVSFLLVANQCMAWGSKEIFEGRYHNDGFGLGYSVFEIKESVAEISLAIGAFCVYAGYRRTRRGGGSGFQLPRRRRSSQSLQEQAGA